MSEGWKRIDKPGDFPTVEVYESLEPKGKNYSIAFKNLEYTANVGITFLSIMAAMLTSILIMVYARELGDPLFGYLLFGSFFLILTVFIIFKQPASVDRNIEFNTGTGLLRVIRKGLVEIERPYKRLHNLTVEDHPDAEFKRSDRQQRGEKNLKIEEKQHCLIGWFGEGGAEQVILLYRAEWPNRNSLFEIQKAILWTIEQSVGMGSDGPDPMTQGPNTIKPPLD